MPAAMSLRRSWIGPSSAVVSGGGGPASVEAMAELLRAPALERPDITRTLQRGGIGHAPQARVAAHLVEAHDLVPLHPLDEALPHDVDVFRSVPEQRRHHLHDVGTREDRLDGVFRLVDA